MENEAAFRELMHKTVERQAASTKSPVIGEEKYDAIRCHLLDPSAKVDPHFRHWVKTREFQIVDLPGLGLHQVLVIPNEQKNQVDGSAKFLRVVHASNVYDVVKGIHVDELKHSGYKKVKDYVDRHYFGITRGFVQEYCKHCPVCQLSQTQVTRPPLRPIIQKEFLERVQVEDNTDSDLVVYSYKPTDTSTVDPVTVTLASDYEKTPEKSHVSWTTTSTQLLIASWIAHKPLFRELPPRQVYSIISSDLKGMGFHFTGEQCSIKWRSLKASFLKSKITSYQREKPSPWIHFQAMAEALDDDAISMESFNEQPSYHNQHDEDDNDNDINIKPDSPQNSPPPPPPPPLQPQPEGSHHSDDDDDNDDDDDDDDDGGGGNDDSGGGSSRRRKNASKYSAPQKTVIGTGKKKSEWMKCFNEMKVEWKTRRDERRRMHEERMELGRRKLSLMEDLITLLKRK